MYFENTFLAGTFNSLFSSCASLELGLSGSTVVKASMAFMPLLLLKVWDVTNPEHMYLTNTGRMGGVLKSKT